MKALYDTIVVEMIKPEEKTESGIIFSSAEKKSEWGFVTLVGPGKLLDSGVVKPLSVKVGDKVLIKSYAGTYFKNEGTEFRAIREDDILVYL